MRQHHNAIHDVTVLEVYGMPDDMIDYEAGKLNTKHLSGAYIRTGLFLSRDSSYVNTPCPVCDQLIPDVSQQRGQVGLARFIFDAFMVVPCQEPSCWKAQEAR